MGLPQERPSQKQQDLPPILSAQPTPEPVQEAPAPKKEKPHSISGFMENALDDAWDLAKGLYEIIPSTLKSYQQNVPYIWKNRDAITPGMLFNWNEKEGEFKGAIPETAKAIIESVKQPYKEHGLDVLYQKPLTVAGDIATVLSLGGGSIKNAGKLAQAAGAGEKAQRLIKIGTFLEELPARAAREGIDLTVKTATGGKWDLAKRRQFLQLKGEEQARRIKAVEADKANVVDKIDALTPQEKEIFHKARVLGDAPGVGVPDAALTPKVKEALDAFADLVNKVDPNLNEHGITEFYKSRGFLNAETAENTLAKKFALEAFGDVSDTSIAKAKELINQSNRKPIYGKNVFVDEMGKSHSADSLLDDMIKGGTTKREGKIGSLEEMRGAKGYTKDPSIYVRDMIKDFRNTEAKARLSERLLEHPELIKGKSTAAAGMKAESIPEGIHRKYYEDPVRAEALKSITDPTIQRLLKWEYIKNNSSLIRVYDRMHALFAKSATMFNPKWVTGNVIGDAVLGMLAGSDWVEGLRHLKAGNMPAQIAAKNVTMSTQEITNPRGRLSSAVHYLPEKAADVAGFVDQATRAGITTKEAARRFKESALSFEGSATTFEDVLRSTDRFSDVQVQMRLLEERAARNSIEVASRDKQIVTLQQREQALHAKLEAVEKKFQAVGQEGIQAAEGAYGKEVQRAQQAYTKAKERLQARYEADLQAASDRITKQVSDNGRRRELFEAKKAALLERHEADLEKVRQRIAAAQSKGAAGKAAHEAKAAATLEEFNAKKRVIESRISEIEREAKGGREIERIADKMDELRKDGAELSKAISEAKSGIDRALTQSEEGLIRSLATNQVLSPDLGLIGKRGRAHAKSLSSSIDQMKAALKNVKQQYESLRREGKALNEAFVTERAQLRAKLAQMKPPAVAEFKGTPSRAEISYAPEVGEFKGKPARAQIVYPPEEPTFNTSRIRSADEAIAAKKSTATLGAAGQKAFDSGLRKLQDMRQKIVNLTKERDMIIRDITDDLAKSGELEKLVPGLKQQVDILRPAVERANAFVGDYLSLDGFEQGVMRRIIPFYPWAKAMSMLAFRLPFIAPIKTFAWNRFSDALNTLTQDPDLPEDFKGRIPVAVLKDGRSVWVKVTAYSPFESLKTSSVAGVPVPQMFNVVERNPFLALGFRFFGGKTIWDASSVPYGEQMVSIGDGTVLRVKPNGKIERDIPQTPLVSGIAHMFPSVQLAEQVLSPYWTNKYNWAGVPEPVLNADGSYKYPRELWDRLGAAVGVNVMTRSREDAIRSRKAKAIKNVREMQSMYKRTTDPDEREFILDATKDYIRQELRGGR